MNEKGVVLISVILVLLITLVLLNTLMAMAVTEIKIAMNEQYGAQLIYLSEAGNEIAVDYLYTNPQFRGELLNLPGFEKPIYIGNGQINSIKVQTASSNVKIISEAEIEGLKRKVALIIKITTFRTEDITETIIDYLIWQYEF